MYVEAQFRNGCQKKNIFLLEPLSMTVSTALSFLDCAPVVACTGEGICVYLHQFAANQELSERLLYQENVQSAQCREDAL